MSISWGHWYPCFGFLVTSPLGFQSQSGFCLIRYFFAEANVMYVPRVLTVCFIVLVLFMKEIFNGRTCFGVMTSRFSAN